VRGFFSYLFVYLTVGFQLHASPLYVLTEEGKVFCLEEGKKAYEFDGARKPYAEEPHQSSFLSGVEGKDAIFEVICRDNQFERLGPYEKKMESTEMSAKESCEEGQLKSRVFSEVIEVTRGQTSMEKVMSRLMGKDAEELVVENAPYLCRQMQVCKNGVIVDCPDYKRGLSPEEFIEHKSCFNEQGVFQLKDGSLIASADLKSSRSCSFPLDRN